MSRATRESLFTLAYVVVGLIAVIAVGYLTLHRDFFHFPRPMFSFLIVGIAGSIIYATVQMRGAGLAIFMVVLLWLTQVAMVPPIRAASLGAAAIFAIPVGFALIAGAYVQKALGGRLKFGRFVVMGLIVAAGYGLMMLLWLVQKHVDIRGNLILRQALVGLELGAAMGLGFELVDLIGPRP
ncbi:hypothetical protein JXD38_07535, partial [candidate division WOR-3 bacterium]|nr:hypothetical protein [candidate division WOR-3 bacterium]